MKLCNVLILIFIPVFLCSQDTNEHKPIFFYGPWAGVNINFHSSSFNKLGDIENCCPEYTGGSGIGFALGGYAEYPFDNKMSLSLNLGYGLYDGEMLENENIGNTAVRDVNTGDVIDTDAFADHHLESALGTIIFEPAFNYKLYKGLRSVGGFMLGFLLSPTVNQREVLTTPENVTFLDGTLRRNEQNGIDIPGANSIQLFVHLGAAYDLPVSEDVNISPYVKYYLPMTNISAEEWKVSALQAGAILRIPFFPPKELPLRKDTMYVRDTLIAEEFGIDREIVKLLESSIDYKYDETDEYELETLVIRELYENRVPEIIDLNTNLRVVGIDEKGNEQNNPTIVIEEIETEETFPLLPYIFFPEMSSDINETNMNLLDVDATSTFMESEIEWNTKAIYSNLLNIVALRMKKYPDAELIIIGCNSNSGDEENNLDLSASRAREVRGYLMLNWNIDPRRIKIDKRNLPANPGRVGDSDGEEENRRVELASNDSRILEHITLKEIARKSNPPVIRMYPEVVTEAGMRNWEIEINQSYANLRKFNGIELEEYIDWHIEEEPVPKLDKPLEFRFNAVDDVGQEDKTIRELDIKQLTIKKKRSEMKDDKRYEKFSLILFDFDKTELTRNQKLSLQSIRDRVMPGSRVIISGYTDRTGDEDYNRDLAEKRAINVRDFLGLDTTNSEIRPVGKSILLYNNDEPWGRSYSRTVQVEIVTPVKI